MGIFVGKSTGVLWDSLTKHEKCLRTAPWSRSCAWCSASTSSTTPNSSVTTRGSSRWRTSSYPNTSPCLTRRYTTSVTIQTVTPDLSLSAQLCIIKQLLPPPPPLPGISTVSESAFCFQAHLPVYHRPALCLAVLIKLKKQDGRCVRKSPFIRPICLPEKNMQFPDGYCCTISGWGYTQESEWCLLCPEDFYPLPKVWIYLFTSKENK